MPLMSKIFSTNCIKKRAVTALLAAVLAFFMFACGESTEADAAAGSVSSGSMISGGAASGGTASGGAASGGTASAGSAAGSVSAASSAARPQTALFGKKKKDSGSGSSGGTTGKTSGAGSGAAGSASGGKYTIPAFRDAKFDASKAEGTDTAMVDMSSCSEGYVAMKCTSQSKIKFQVLKDDATYTYSVVSGADQIFPLQCGDGHYTFKVMENIADNKYAELYKCETDVKLADPLDPFLRPNQYANYSENSECVKKARGFAQSASGEDEFIMQIYKYVCDNITYDKECAMSVKSGYLPDPDKTMYEKKGICFDYACLAAAMLRSQGVPTKIIFGYVAPNDAYHAWNKFYTEDGGWTLVEFKVTGKDWNRIDLTFSANGADSKFIGDGTNYMEASEY